MAETTGISWADATFNPWVGCSKVSPGCAHCYAETLVTGRMGRANTWGELGHRERTSPSNWKKPLHWAKLTTEGLLPNGKPNLDGHRPRIFCASLADVFEPRAEVAGWRYDLLELIDATPELDWLLLTKRPEVAHELFFGGHLSTTANMWIGTSIENSRFTWRADALREIPVAIRFISAEPLVSSLFPGTASEGPLAGAAELERLSSTAPAHMRPGQNDAQGGAGGAHHRAPLDLSGIDWVIVGGESGGRNARPMHRAWAREIRDACIYGHPHAKPAFHGAGITSMSEEDFGRWWNDRPKLHFKQWGSWTPDPHGHDRNGVWVSPDGRARTSLAADAYDDLPDGSIRMRYAGAAPKSGGKMLDGVEWCEFPEPRSRRRERGPHTKEDLMSDRSTELERIERGLALPAGAAHHSGLSLTNPDTTFDEWQQIGHTIGAVDRWARFALGDWLIFGESLFGEDAAQAVEGTAADRYDIAQRVTGLKVETLQNYVSICSRVPLPVRKENLPLSMHEPVAALDREEQMYWLEQAVKNSYDRAELRQEIKDAKNPPREDGPEVVDPKKPMSIKDRIEEAARLVFNQALPTTDGSMLVPREPWVQFAAALGEE